jgi:hypothetical protein
VQPQVAALLAGGPLQVRRHADTHVGITLTRVHLPSSHHIDCMRMSWPAAELTPSGAQPNKPTAPHAMFGSAVFITASITGSLTLSQAHLKDLEYMNDDPSAMHVLYLQVRYCTASHILAPGCVRIACVAACVFSTARADWITRRTRLSVNQRKAHFLALSASGVSMLCPCACQTLTRCTRWGRGAGWPSCVSCWWARFPGAGCV